MDTATFLTVFRSSLLEYVKDENNQKIGVMLAFRQDGKIHFGWSKCKVKGTPEEIDTFDKDMGIHIAFSRASKYFNTDSLNISVYFRMRDQFVKFMMKAHRFYTKDGKTFEFPSFFDKIAPTEQS